MPDLDIIFCHITLVESFSFNGCHPKTSLGVYISMGLHHSTEPLHIYE